MLLLLLVASGVSASSSSSKVVGSTCTFVLQFFFSKKETPYQFLVRWRSITFERRRGGQAKGSAALSCVQSRGSKEQRDGTES